MSCPDCFKGIALAGDTVGSISTNGAYFSPAPSGTSKAAVVLLTDAFGLDLNNPKVMADLFAKELDCDVWVPDLFDGRPPTPERAGDKMSFWAKLQLFFLILKRLPVFIFRCRPSLVDKRITDLVSKIQANKKYEKIGAVGYCFGGSAAIRLGPTGVFNTLVIAHPGGFSFKDVEALNVPSSWACAEEDMSFSPEKRLKAEVIIAAKKEKNPSLDYEFIDYKGTTHGFAARPNLDYPEVKEGFEACMAQTVNWFKKTLTV
ncbi:dienelactone hydrolase endo-1,3,1,4-beta-D-glucanase [Hymenopellis radicata]|nr:dienelactone hydrolase endo-1,3,1,4-beta-D-glucanase [Hymenopellis radicata]